MASVSFTFTLTKSTFVPDSTFYSGNISIFFSITKTDLYNYNTHSIFRISLLNCTLNLGVDLHLRFFLIIILILILNFSQRPKSKKTKTTAINRGFHFWLGYLRHLISPASPAAMPTIRVVASSSTSLFLCLSTCPQSLCLSRCPLFLCLSRCSLRISVSLEMSSISMSLEIVEGRRTV